MLSSSVDSCGAHLFDPNHSFSTHLCSVIVVRATVAELVWSMVEDLMELGLYLNESTPLGKKWGEGFWTRLMLQNLYHTCLNSQPSSTCFNSSSHRSIISHNYNFITTSLGPSFVEKCQWDLEVCKILTSYPNPLNCGLSSLMVLEAPFF